MERLTRRAPAARGALGVVLAMAITAGGSLAATDGHSVGVAPSDGPDVAFDEPVASGDFGEPVTFRTTFRSTVEPMRVELLRALPDDEGRRVDIAAFERTGPETWVASLALGGHIVPNTRYDYRFRVVTEDGAALGPQASHRVADTRLAWQWLAGEHVTVWWHRGDRTFAEGALGVAEGAVAEAAGLLGRDAVGPVDFFIYSDGDAFRDALGPATRENVGGQAHVDIDTLFGLIEPRQVGSDWVTELIVHEMVHLVFDEAVRNPYAYPPRWLNEGLAVYLARGYDAGDRAQVEGAARARTIIPLEGLGGQFPTRPSRFGLAYAESVAAVDFLVNTYGEAALVNLITSFADGRDLDEAFRAATGQGFLAFEDAWLGSLGATRPEPYGPPSPALGSMVWVQPSRGGALLR